MRFGINPDMQVLLGFILMMFIWKEGQTETKSINTLFASMSYKPDPNVNFKRGNRFNAAGKVQWRMETNRNNAKTNTGTKMVFARSGKEEELKADEIAQQPFQDYLTHLIRKEKSHSNGGIPVMIHSRKRRKIIKKIIEKVVLKALFFVKFIVKHFVVVAKKAFIIAG